MDKVLTDRSERVSTSATLSTVESLEIGVPQGSVLGSRKYCMFSKFLSEIYARVIKCDTIAMQMIPISISLLSQVKTGKMWLLPSVLLLQT
jgi:hypothetical protein